MNEEQNRLRAELERRASPILTRGNEAAQYVAEAREHCQKAGELLLRADRSLRGELFAVEAILLGRMLLEIAESEGADPTRGFRALIDSIKPSMDEMIGRFSREIQDEIQSGQSKRDAS